MSTSPFRTMYDAFVDDSYCEEPSATLCNPQTTTQASDMQLHSDLTEQWSARVAAVCPFLNAAGFTPFQEPYLNNFDRSCLYTPKPTRPPRTHTQKHRFHPYPSRTAPWETPAAIAPSVGLTPAALLVDLLYAPVTPTDLYILSNGSSWDLASYNSDLGFSCPHPQVLLTAHPSVVDISACRPPHPDAASHDDDELSRQLAASISDSATISPFLNSSAPSPFYGELSSSSSAALATPTGAADVQEGESSEVDQVEERLQSDMAVVTNPAITATINVHTQQNAAGGVATTVGSVVLPFPADRNALLDLLQQGTHLQCIMPSVRYNKKRIVCLGKHKLREGGSFVEGNKVCGKVCASEDIYGRHVKVVHMGMDSTRTAGSLNIRDWIRRVRPDVPVRMGDPRQVVQGARVKAMDLRIRGRSRKSEENPS